MANNQVNIPQFQGQVQVLRRINPTAGDILGFNASTNKLESRAPNVAAGGTVVSPVITGSAGTGFLVAKRVNFVEDATSVTHTATIAIPAGATLHDIQVDQGVLWTGGTATLKIGDTADDDGYFTGVNLKATDLLVGEQLSLRAAENWGGKQGAYMVAATGQRGPTSSNFGGKYVAGSNITAIVTVGTPATTVGRTYVTVIYSSGEAVTPVLA